MMPISVCIYSWISFYPSPSGLRWGEWFDIYQSHQKQVHRRARHLWFYQLRFWPQCTARSTQVGSHKWFHVFMTKSAYLWKSEYIRRKSYKIGGFSHGFPTLIFWHIWKDTYFFVARAGLHFCIYFFEIDFLGHYSYLWGCKTFYWCGQTWLWSDSTVKLSPTPTHQSNTSLTTTVPSSGPESETFLSGLGTCRQVTFKVLQYEFAINTAIPM